MVTFVYPNNKQYADIGVVHFCTVLYVFYVFLRGTCSEPLSYPNIDGQVAKTEVWFFLERQILYLPVHSLWSWMQTSVHQGRSQSGKCSQVLGHHYDTGPFSCLVQANTRPSGNQHSTVLCTVMKKSDIASKNGVLLVYTTGHPTVLHHTILQECIHHHHVCTHTHTHTCTHTHTRTCTCLGSAWTCGQNILLSLYIQWPFFAHCRATEKKK